MVKLVRPVLLGRQFGMTFDLDDASKNILRFFRAKFGAHGQVKRQD